MSTFILGINCFHADSAACLVRDGEVVAAAEEERFRRIKHWAGFPTEAIRYCLDEAGISVHDLDHVAVNRDPKANLFRKALFGLTNRPSYGLIRARLANTTRVRHPVGLLAAACHTDPTKLHARFHSVEHHLAHLASAFYVSPFERAAVVSVDGFGDFVSAMWGVGAGDRIDLQGRVRFPHSLGLFYQAVTQLLGFWNYGDEYKVMGLAPYGAPTELPAMRGIVRLLPDGGHELDLDCFRHHAEGVEIVWDGGAVRSAASSPTPCASDSARCAQRAPRSPSITRTSPPRFKRCTRRPCSTCCAMCTLRHESPPCAWRVAAP
jgi:carbamoyltransferase